ncbi:protein suppressor of white apricot-like isoform X2 [Anopheles bellator]|nr:protein suppressor of white apricot-like isoform X2 [Anopheles bellator]XP_058062519.1 protein suppressor of white apricot-like isoform X2 [Anopheles bellator]XP_058062521.1 protein suppressor of white apricot-like isoform X2 [Anopheles bellator]
MYQEETLKRETRLGNQIAFNYDAPPAEAATVATVEERSASDQEDDPYVLPANFEVPSDIPLPETMKEHAIIEKTAKFIASQDVQMEILLKTKQSNNPQFNFLNQSSHLFRYYRHVLLAFRTNQYPCTVEQQDETERQSAEVAPGDGDIERDGEVAGVRPVIVVPTIKYKPSVDCAYTQLISKITGTPIPTMSENPETNEEQAPEATQSATLLLNESESCVVSSEPATCVEVKSVSTGLAGLVQYDSGSSDEENYDASKRKSFETGEKNETEPLLPFTAAVPALAIQHVIDRTAIYVAKNGYSFEEALRAKKDPRFVFLNQAHQFYPYYAYCVRQRMNASGGGSASTFPSSSPPKATVVRMETENGTVVETTPSLGIITVHTAAPKTVAAPVSKIQHQKLGAPVSFSLPRKAKDDAGSKVLASDDDEEEAVKETESQEHVSDGLKLAQAEVELTNNPLCEEVPPTSTTIVNSNKEVVDDIQVDACTQDVHETKASIQTESIGAEENQATEQEPMVSKEKQAERKKRASMFVNLIKHADQKTPVSAAAVDAERTPGTKSPTPDGDVSNDVDEGSIHSIHSTSASPKDQRFNTIMTTVTTVIDDDDDDVVLVSETRLAPRRSRSRLSRSCSRGIHVAKVERSCNNDRNGSRRSKKKKSKSRHRSRDGGNRAKSKKKSKKKSLSRSRSRERSRSKRDRSQSKSPGNKRHSHSRSRKRSRSRNSSRNPCVKRSRVHRANSSPSASSGHSRSRSRSKSKRSENRRPKDERSSRVKKHSQTKDRSNSRASRGRSDSDSDGRYRRRQHEKKERDRKGHDDRYPPPSRTRYWDC